MEEGVAQWVLFWSKECTCPVIVLFPLSEINQFSKPDYGFFSFSKLESDKYRLNLNIDLSVHMLARLLLCKHFCTSFL